MSVVGFDFGTVNCKIAVARRRGIDVLQNETGHRMTPAALGFQGKQRFIGGEALAQYMNNAKNTSTNIKRLLGRKSDDVDTKIEEKFITTKLTKTRSNDVGVQVMYEDAPLILSPEQITSAVLFKLKSIAEKGLDGLKVTDCVIGVPANWTDSQRRALLDAARIAGLNVLRLMNESTAIALSYGILRPLPKDTTHKVLFLDMGYAHTQTSVVSFQEGKLKVLAHNVDRNLGGRDFDEMLTQYLVDYIKGKYKMDPTTEFKPMVKLRREAERIKVYLSANSKVPFNLEYFMNDKDVSGIVERPQFDQLAQEKLMPKVIELIKNTLEKANVKKEELQSIEIVGGAVRIPIVQKALQDYFGREMSKTCDGDESVARGCALMCAMISPTFKVKEFEVEDSTPYAIDLLWGPIAAKGAEDKWQPEDSTPLFPVNNSIPSVKLISFNDRSDPFQIVARYAEVGQLPPGTNPVIGRFTISGIPQSGDRKGKIKVKVKLSANSVLSVTSAQLLEEVKEETAAAAAPAAATADAAASAAEPKKEGNADDMDTDKDGDKMETESTAKDTKKDAAKPEEKKIKVKKIDLKVDSVFTAGLDDATINQYFEKENAMQHQDRLIQETHEARNSLEGYILDMRARLTGDLSAYVKDADRDSFNSLLLDTEDWLNNDGFDVQKSEYKKKLDELHAVGNPIKQRQYEDQNRESYIRAIKSATHNAITFVANKEEKYAHITDEERKKISAEVEKIEQWLLQTQSQQDKLSKADTPVLTCQLLNNKKTEFEKIIHPIMTKPKPAPPKEEKKPEPAAEKKDEKKAEETKPAADAKPADAKSTENMDTSK